MTRQEDREMKTGATEVGVEKAQALRTDWGTEAPGQGDDRPAGQRGMAEQTLLKESHSETNCSL